MMLSASKRRSWLRKAGAGVVLTLAVPLSVSAQMCCTGIPAPILPTAEAINEFVRQVEELREADGKLDETTLAAIQASETGEDALSSVSKTTVNDSLSEDE